MLKWPWHWLLLCVALFSVSFHRYHDWLDVLLLHGNDPLGYYQFLPGLFIEHDLYTLHWVHVLENGQHLSLFTIGVAIMQSPFFLLGHLLALLFGAPATGFSWPYAAMHLLGAAVYGTGGLALLAASLRGECSGYARAIAIIVLLFGTNLLYYIVGEPGMSHVYSFFLFAWLWYLVSHSTIRRWVPLLFVCATLIVLVRPLNGVALLLPAILCHRAIAEHWRGKGVRPFAIGASLAALLLAPQLWYWHFSTGKWLLFTYGAKGESFDFAKPMLGAVLFSHQNGWFTYAPLLFAPWCISLVQALRGDRAARTVMLVWALLWFTYASWWAWWLGGAYGFRGFIEISAWFSPTMAWGVDRIRKWPRSARGAMASVTVFFLLLNLRMTSLYEGPWDGPDWTWSRLVDVWREALWIN